MATDWHSPGVEENLGKKKPRKGIVLSQENSIPHRQLSLPEVPVESLWAGATPLGALSGLGDIFASSLRPRVPHLGPLGKRSPGFETLLGSLLFWG